VTTREILGTGVVGTVEARSGRFAAGEPSVHAQSRRPGYRGYMPARAYAQLALASLTLAVCLFAFSDSFTVAVLAFGLLTIGSVSMCVAMSGSAESRRANLS
jgi:hypothetical protein